MSDDLTRAQAAYDNAPAEPGDHAMRVGPIDKLMDDVWPIESESPECSGCGQPARWCQCDGE